MSEEQVTLSEETVPEDFPPIPDAAMNAIRESVPDHLEYFLLASSSQKEGVQSLVEYRSKYEQSASSRLLKEIDSSEERGNEYRVGTIGTASRRENEARFSSIIVTWRVENTAYQAIYLLSEENNA